MVKTARFVRLCLLAACSPPLLLCAQHSDNGQTSPVFAQSSAKPDPTPNGKKTATVPPDYSNEPAVLEQSASIFRYNADGTGDHTLRSVVHLQSDATVRQFGVLSFPFAANDESIEVRYIRVRKPDGTVIVTDASAAQDMPAEVTRQAPLYSDLHQLQIPVRSLGVGDRLEYELVVHVRKAQAPGEFWEALNFEKKAVALDEQIELQFPEALKVTVLSPHAKAEIRTEHGDRIYQWHSRQLKPSVAPPGGVAPTEDDHSPDLSPDVAWTTFPDWAAVGAWYRNLAADRATPTAELRAKAAALTAGATTDEDKIARIYSFVSMQIRYVGIDFGIGRFQPHTAGEVISNGYGDCKDKHTLLAALLTAEGFHVEPVLIGANIEFDKELTAPNSFNHVITVVELAGGKRLWLDSTAEVAPPGMLFAAIRDKDALLIPAAGAASLVKTPATPPFDAFDKYDAKAVLSSDGKLTAHFDATLHGDSELYMRAALFSAGRAQWQQLGQALSQGMGFGGSVTAFSPTAVDTPGSPLGFTYEYTRDSLGDWPNHRIVSLIPNGLFAMNILEKQPDKPIELGAPRVESARSAITIPDGFSIPDLPASVHAHSSFAIFDLTYSRLGRVLVTEQRLQFNTSSIPASQWQECNSFAKDIANSENAFIQLVEGSGTPETTGTSKPAVAVAPGTPAAPPAKDENLDVATQAVLLQGEEALKAGQMDVAQKRLDAARRAHPEQRGVWLLAYNLAAQKRSYDEAETDLNKEIALHPDEHDRLLPFVLGIQLRSKHNADAIKTLETMRKLQPDRPELTREEAALLTEEKRHEEAVSLLEAAAFRNSSDKLTMLALGRAQFAAGRNREAQITLETTLDGTTDPEILNDAAYELADRNIDLAAAQKDARQALELLETQTHSLTPEKLDQISKKDLGYQRLLSATWDTLGWIDYLQGDTADAESLLRVAWISSQHPEVGYHLGAVLEKAGKSQEAFEIYTLAEASRSGGEAFTHADTLRTRENTLAAQGLKTNFPQSPVGMLGQQRSINLPLLVNKESHADFLVLASASSIQKVALIEGDAALASQASPISDALRKVSSRMLLPSNSAATVLRRGTLSCSPVIHACQFVLFLPQDTKLPSANSTPAAQPKTQASRQ